MFVKRAGESRRYDYDFGTFAEMVEGERIAIINSIVSEPPGLVILKTTDGQSRAQGLISGGEAGVIYRVIYTITTNAESVLVGEGRLRVIED